MELKNVFFGGRMNKDIDSRMMPNGEYRDALNIKVSSSQGSDAGAVENILSTEQLTTLTLGTTVNTIGAFFDSSAAMIYWFVNSDTGDYVVEYDTILDTATIILTDTSAGVLNFSTDNLITGVGVLVDSDNDRRILLWTDDLNPIRSVNIATAKTYAANGFNDAQISTMKPAPLEALTMSLGNTASDEENNIVSRFLRFAHRYRYADGEISALSPFTETAFLPKTFSYDYATSSNESMENQFNKVDLSFNTGVAEVVGIDIVMKESNSSTVYLVESFNKEEELWANSATESFTFTNNKTYTPLAEDQLTRLYDAVPLKAKALELIGNRLVLGNYTEGYNIATSGGDRIKIEFTLSANTTAISSGTPTTSLKSNRDYEIGIVYLDDYGRMSTVLTSAENTVYIENSDCINQNKIQVTLVNEPPYWATKYRFFLKQTRTDYETIVPSAFYNDGVYVWIKIEADEQNKFSVGDFLYIKADSTEVLGTAVQTRVLEIVDQPVNFLDETITATVEQLAGTYFKIKPSGFRLNEDDFSIYENISYGFRSSATSNNFDNDTVSYVEDSVFYGTSALDDITITGTYTGSTDIRYIIDINAVGLPDSYRWSDDDGANYSADIPITTTAQPLGTDGLSVTFANSSGHDLSDNWIVSAKSGTVTIDWRENSGDPAGDPGRRAIVSYAGKPSTGPTGETISGGAQITIVYDDTESDGAAPGLSYSQTFTSTTNYANIEEWFFGDNIINTLTYPTTLDRVVFRRGNQFSEPSSNGPERVNIDPTGDQMIMCFLSSESYNGGESIRVNKFSTPSMSILELNNNIIFETIPENDDSNLFYEIGRTYDITGGYHQGFDVGDTNQTAIADAVLTLPVFNCFAWGNGFESYKIKDLFNAKTMKIDTRPSTTIDNFKQNKRIADLTYSKPFEQSTDFNGLNEFNLSNANFLQMDDKYGSIQKLFSADTNLEVYQENKVHNVLYEKDIIFDADGNGTIRETTNVLGTTPSPWAGEYGISTHPESFAFYGNRRYFTDARRGALIRRSQDGITEVTSGMGDFFRDAFKGNQSNRKFGAYDTHDEEYVLYDQGRWNIAYSESIKGFPSFYSFEPQWMGSLNNEFYSFSNGQLYKHYDESNPVRNNFYGVDYDSTMKLIVNEGPSEIKVLKNLIIEGNKAWATTVKSYLNDETISVTQSTLLASEYLRKEGKLYAYVRRNELTGDLTAKNAYGIGVVATISVLTVGTGTTLPTSLAIGDEIYDGSDNLIGTVTGVDRTTNSIVLDSVVGLSVSEFIYGVKTGRIEGSEIRGYNFEIDIVDDSNTRTELFAIGSNVFKSFPS